MEKRHKYATNTILMNRMDINNVVHAESENNKIQEKIQQKYNRNVFIQRNNENGRAVEFDFLDNGKPKSHIYYNKKGLPVKEIYTSNYGIGDYVAVSSFEYDENDNLIQVKTKIDNDLVYVRNYQG